jgi:hypothetical protein
MLIFYLIIIIGIIGYVIDINKNGDFKDCKDKIEFQSVLLFHHLLSAYFILGILSNNVKFLKVYAVSLMILYTSWIIYDHTCLVSYYNNKIGNLDYDLPFRGVMSYVLEPYCGKPKRGEKSWMEYVQVPVFFILTLLKIGQISN